MNARRFTACFSVIISCFFGVIPPLSPAQRRAETADDCMSFAREFLQLFYPELSGKNYAIIFETASMYDEPVSDADRIFLVDIGDGAKYYVLKCCFGGSMGGIVGAPKLPDDKDLGPHQPLPAPPPPPKARTEEPMNIDSHGAVHSYQYLSTVFVFDSQGRLKNFVWKGTASAADMRFSDKLVLHPEMTDEELVAAYKETGAKYAFGDREAFERDLPISKLEQIVNEAESFVIESAERERKTSELGELIMNRLRRYDKVAYVRFASVYLDFKDVKEFMNELKDLVKVKAV